MSKVNLYAMMNLNLLLKMIEKEDYETLKLHVESHFTKHNRKFVFAESEVMMMLSNMLREITESEYKNELADKFTAALWFQVKDILEGHKVI